MRVLGQIMIGWCVLAMAFAIAWACVYVDGVAQAFAFIAVSFVMTCFAGAIGGMLWPEEPGDDSHGA